MDEKMTDNVQTPDDDSGVTRRAFVKVAVGGAACVYAGAVGYPVYEYLATPVEKEAAEAAIKEVDLPGADKLPAGSTMKYKFGTSPALLIHFNDGTWSSLTAVCTHLGCTLDYLPPAPRIHCACHGSEFDPHTGQNLAGPAPKPLKTYKVAVAPGKVTITRS